jgi:alpha-tubulin suppressor-like RCC1 family protein
MPYKISGTKSETGRIMVLKESDWSIESNTVVSGSGDYSIEDLETGDKSVLARSNDGEVIGFGSVSAVEYEYMGTRLWAWGNNPDGQLGLEDIVNRSSPVQVSGLITDFEDFSAGYDHTIISRTDGTLWSWGDNTHGKLGLGDLSYRSSPSQVGALTTWSTVSVSEGYPSAHGVAIKTDGTLWSWGYNHVGQLGDGTQIEKNFPVPIGDLTNWSTVSVGTNYVLAIKTDGTLWGWGNNTYGQLGISDVPVNRSSPVQLGGLTTWSKVVASDAFSLAIKTDGTLWGWGNNYRGELGIGSSGKNSTPIQIGTLTTWSDVSTGNQNSSAVRTDGTIWSWGYGAYGQLGLGATTEISSPVQVGTSTEWNKVNCGGYHTLAIKTDGTIWAWGSNGYGQLGLGDTTNRNSPIQVGNLTTWESVAGGSHYTLAFG